MLDGMFAFTILDKVKNKIYLVRDFFGEKPLYFTKQHSGVYWASELKSIKKIVPESLSLSQEAMELFFQLTYIPSPYSIYKDVYKLLPNHCLEIDIKTNEYNQFEISSSIAQDFKEHISFDSAKSKTRELVTKSIASRCVSDVPVGTFLSGGVDSSIVSFCLANHKGTPIDTFSMGFEKKSFDETEKSRLVAKLIGSHHHEFIVKPEDIKEDIHKVLLNYDEPFADSSALPTYLLSKLTSNHVKVALTGDGGDEVFGGYNKYYMGRLNDKYTNFVPKTLHHKMSNFIYKLANSKNDKRGKRYKLKRFLDSLNYEGKFYNNIISLGFQNNELSKLFNNKLKFNVFDQLVNKTSKSLVDFRSVDKQISLEGDLLVKVDRASMLNSIECRSPFLNKELWQFTNKLPENYLIRGWNKKHILKEAFKNDFPDNFLNKSKKGFGVPVGDWLRGFLKQELLSYTEKNVLIDQDLFNVDYIQRLVINHLDQKHDNTFKVWCFYCFQKWYFNQN
jgi:asparagine synthase (glutamine-hydrolysing)